MIVLQATAEIHMHLAGWQVLMLSPVYNTKVFYVNIYNMIYIVLMFEMWRQHTLLSAQIIILVITEKYKIDRWPNPSAH